MFYMCVCVGGHVGGGGVPGVKPGLQFLNDVIIQVSHNAVYSMDNPVVSRDIRMCDLSLGAVVTHVH